VPRLSELLQRAGVGGAIAPAQDVLITDITADSRQAKAGSVYVAVRGVHSNGEDYIADAIARGAHAVVTEAANVTADVPVLQVADARAAISALADALYPQQPEHLFAITGTDGKTSTADFLRQLSGMLGHKAASVGTLGLRSPIERLNAQFPAINTSPEPVLLRRILSSLADAGVTHAAIEASSHGLDQKRLDGLRFSAAAFTNLTRDHLDYHGTVEAYATAKARLFSAVLPITGLAVLNRDDAQFEALSSICAQRGMRMKSFGLHAAADYRILAVTPHAGGLDAQLNLLGKTLDVSLPLYGAFQLFNILAALAMLDLAPAALEGVVRTHLPRLSGVPGRLEKIAEHHGAPIFVDYAHTPAALENILKTLRPHTAAKLRVVFGAGGDRDAGKRHEMGAAAAAHADDVIITDDNPRSEDPAAIRAAIAAAAPGAETIADRAVAIRTAIKKLQPGDVLVVAGKGHETTQTIGSDIIHFSDAEHIREAVGTR